jgi:hypothetical protein
MPVRALPQVYTIVTQDSDLGDAFAYTALP